MMVMPAMMIIAMVEAALRTISAPKMVRKKMKTATITVFIT
jgi:hypothetical protein